MKKALPLLMAFILIVTFFSGCAGDSGDKGGDSKTPSITIFAHGLEQYDGADKDRVWEEIEKKTNTKIELSGTPLTNYNEKINIMVNTGEAPDLFFYLPERSETYSKWVQQGMITPLDEYVKDDSKYPNLYKLLNSDTFKNLTYENQRTLVPWVALQNNWAVYIRKDWLDNLGLSVPKTMDEYLDVMKKFTQNDPDKNGKNDTYGLCSAKGIYWFMPFYAAYVKKPDWNYSKDKTTMEHMYYTEEYKQFLGVMAKAYADGLIVKDYYTKSDELKIEDFASGKAGIMVHNSAGHISNLMDKTAQASPTAKVEVIAPPEGPAGANMHGWGGWWGGYSTSSNCKNVDAALRILEFMHSEEGAKLRFNGIENVLYTAENDEVKVTEANLAERAKEPQGRFQLIKLDGAAEEQPFGPYGWGGHFGSVYTIEGGNVKALENINNIKYRDLTKKALDLLDPYISSSDMMNITVSGTEFAQINKRLDDQANTYTTNIIVGRKSVDEGFKEYMEKAKGLQYEKAGKLAFEAAQNAKK